MVVRLTCLRDAGLGIADLREFTRMLRADAPGRGSDERVAFLHRRRQELLDRRRALDAALTVLAEKLNHYGTEAAIQMSDQADAPR